MAHSLRTFSCILGQHIMLLCHYALSQAALHLDVRKFSCHIEGWIKPARLVLPGLGLKSAVCFQHRARMCMCVFASQDNFKLMCYNEDCLLTERVR